MSDRLDPRERWRWEEEREREDRRLDTEGRFARHGGDPRWGTGGLRVERPVRTWRARMGVGSPIAPGPYIGRGPRGYHRSDTRLYEDVCDRLTEHGGVDAADVEVTVSAGEVVLSGTVPTQLQKQIAEEIARSVTGIVAVTSRLRIERPLPEPATMT